MAVEGWRRDRSLCAIGVPSRHRRTTISIGHNLSGTVRLFSAVVDSIYFGKCRREASTQVSDADHGECVLAAGQSQHERVDGVGMPNHIDEVVSAWPVPTIEPVLDRPFAGAGPAHDRLYCLMCPAKLGS
jgi:hypothetical protein